jgi:hypothetical protein
MVDRSGSDDDMSRFIRLIPIGLLAAFPLMLWLNYPDPLPPVSAIIGCFRNPSAPDIFIDGRSIRFGGPGAVAMPYEFARSKDGLLTIRPGRPVRLSVEAGGKFAFIPQDSGLERFISLKRDIGGKSYAALKPEDTQFLEVSLDWYRSVRFVRAASNQCATAA